MSPHEQANERAAALPRFSLKRPTTVLVLLASALVLGGVATTFIPLELIPRGFSEPFLQVWAPWRDAPAPEVIEKLIRPLEEELATVGSLKGMYSYGATGFGRISLVFKQGTDMDVAYREVRDRIERARVRLPDDLEQVHIRKHDDSGIPVAMYGLTIDPSLSDAYDLIETGVVTRLKRLDGVADVQVRGQLEREIIIELDRAATEAAGLNIYQLAQELGRDNFTMASGSVEQGGKKLPLRSVARYEDVEELRQRWVAPAVRLRDVATVKYEEPEKTFRVRALSLPAVAIQVFKEGDANTLAVAKDVADEVERLQADPRLANIGLTTLFNQGDVISESLDTLLDSGKVGGLFAILVLFFFLRRLRMTLIITLSIPLSILVSITAMYFAGETLNIISLLGLMISVGLLVDNSVVVAENIFRMHRNGLSRRRACIDGATEIALAITMATLTTIIVFLPASLVEGQGQFFLIRLAMPICISLAASLAVALVLIPLAVYFTLPEAGRTRETRWTRQHQRVNEVLRRLYDGTLGRVNDFYGQMLSASIRRRLDVVLLLVLVLVATSATFSSRVEFVESQESEERGFHIGVQLPQSTTMEEAEELFLEMESIVESHKEDYGLDGWFIFHRATRGEVEGWFPAERTVDLTAREITERLVEELPERAGVQYFTGEDGERDEGDRDTFRVTLYGEDSKVLERVADEMGQRLVGVQGVLGLKDTGEPPVDEMALLVDRDRAQRLGVNPQVVAGVVGYALRGQSLPRYSSEGKEIPVRVRFREEDRESLSELENYSVPTAHGGTVPLSSLTEVRYLPTSSQIRRDDRRTAMTVALEMEEGTESETRQRLWAAVAAYDLPEGVRLDASTGGDADEELQNLLFALGLSIVFIYLLMAFLFESFALPLSIVLTIPLAFIGVAWSHILTGYDIDFLGAVGVVLLIGVVVNNGIVLIDYVNRLRDAGHERTEALLLAAHRRFRPIMMTAMTTICGMLPLLWGSGASQLGLSYTSFALSLVGGLITATLLTLLVVPIFYTLFDDLRHYLTGVVSWATSRSPSRRIATDP